MRSTAYIMDWDSIDEAIEMAPNGWTYPEFMDEIGGDAVSFSLYMIPLDHSGMVL